MSKTLAEVLLWTPRVLGIIVALFYVIPAAHVWHEPGDRNRVVALLLNLVPSLLVAASVALGWRSRPLGAIAFLVLGVAYLARFWGRFPWFTYAIAAGPLFLVSALFLVGHLLGGRHPAP